MAGQIIWRSFAALAVAGAGVIGYYYYTGSPAPYPVSELPFLKKAAQAATAPATPAGGQPPAQARPPVPVLVGKAERKAMPVRLDALGTVTTIATVNIRARAESQIMEVAFRDGASVKAGDVLFQLDARQIEAQIRQAEATLARDRAQATANDSDLKRAQELARRDFASEQRLDQARAAAETQRAVVRATEANIDNLRVQLGFYTITAPISGRIGAAGLRIGNIAKTGDNSPMLATINQTSPIYVAFSVPQRHLADLKNAITDVTASVVATPQGINRSATGRIAFVDNAVDTTTGTILARAEFPNADELLWPGALTTVRINLRTEADALVVPREAVQTGQTGNFVFVVEGDVARVRPVTVNRTQDTEIVITAGLQPGESVVTDGHLLLTNGSRIAVRQPGSRPPGSPPPSAQQPRPNQG
jgi:RND family efflux transporter MFP subunit